MLRGEDLEGARKTSIWTTSGIFARLRFVTKSRHIYGYACDFVPSALSAFNLWKSQSTSQQCKNLRFRHQSRFCGRPLVYFDSWPIFTLVP
jgi:hypothetical protein